MSDSSTNTPSRHSVAATPLQGRDAPTGRSRRARRRDRGMTLPEVMISVTILGIVVSTLATVTSVIIRQLDNTEGRTNNARSEQNVGTWMPTDLASAEVVSTEAFDVPCGPTTARPAAPACPASANLGGSSALMLSWSGSIANGSTGGVAIATLTVVSYRVIEIAGEFRLIRVHCTGPGTTAAGFSVTPACDTQNVLRDLIPPPAGTAWIPGVTKPSWVLTVSNALAADDVSGPGATVADPGLDSKNARRVVVTINGGGDVAGAGGGQNQISLSAGGTNREYDLSTDSLSGAPTFTAARSRCGGNFGVIVDKSGSIGGDMPTVRSGVKGFIDAFAGTPVKIQVVTFSATSATLDGAGGWTKYYDMLVDSDVTALKGLVDGVNAGGGTNWEDGLFRMLRNSDGTVQAQLPGTILFFTDGIPTRSRIDATSASAPVVIDPLDGGLPPSNGGTFSQVAWNRSERLIRDRGSINLVGVYVNSDVEASSDWMVAGAGYHDVYEMGNTVVFEQGSPAYERGNAVVYQQSVTTYDKANNVQLERSIDSDMTYQRWTGSTWASTTWTLYSASNTVPGDTDGWRTNITGSLSNNNSNWSVITNAQYFASNSNTGSSDGFRSRVVSGSTTPWTVITLAQYNGSNTTADSSDGWRTTTAWNNITQAAYDAGNVNSSSTDGYRTQVSGTNTSWTGVTSTQYTNSNTTTDSSDGWRTLTVWAATTQALYEASNTSSSESDGWRTRAPSAPATWAAVSQTQYTKSNTSADELDGWRTYRQYSPPFTAYEGVTSFPIKNYATIGNIVVSNVTGVQGNYVEALPRGGPYTNAEAADLFVLPDYTNFSAALAAIALGQCGGTVTLQTKIGSASALDPFTYENAATDEIVTTSAAYRSGTFDVALPGGASQTVTINPQDFTSLAGFVPVSWSCKSGGVPYPFTVVPLAGHAPWSGIQLTVSPNKAVSCTQQVAFV